MRKIFRHIHLWLSVPFGLIITLICFSGAMLVFEAEIMKIFRHDLYYVKEVKEATLPADKIMENVAGILPDDVTATGLNIFANPERSYQVSLSKPRRSSLFVDPYTGEVLGKYERSPFFLTMFKLHRWLLDSMKPGSDIFVGKLVVGISTLIFVFILISGIVIWWPRTRKALVNSLKISTGKGLKRFWYDLHVAGGMYILLFLLVMALTGLTWSFSWYRTGFYRLFGVEVQQRKSGKASSSPHGKEKKNEHDGTKSDVSYTYWQQVYEELPNKTTGINRLPSRTVQRLSLSAVSEIKEPPIAIHSIPITEQLPRSTYTRIPKNRVKYEAGYTRYTSETGAGHSPAYSILSPLWAVLLSR